MNKIDELYQNMSHSELLKAIGELKESSKTGILKEGICRKYERKLSKLTETSSSQSMLHNQINIYREAAFRWYEDSFPL